MFDDETDYDFKSGDEQDIRTEIDSTTGNVSLNVTVEDSAFTTTDQSYLMEPDGDGSSAIQLYAMECTAGQDMMQGIILSWSLLTGKVHLIEFSAFDRILAYIPFKGQAAPTSTCDHDSFIESAGKGKEDRKVLPKATEEQQDIPLFYSNIVPLLIHGIMDMNERIKHFRKPYSRRYRYKTCL